MIYSSKINFKFGVLGETFFHILAQIKCMEAIWKLSDISIEGRVLVTGSIGSRLPVVLCCPPGRWRPPPPPSPPQIQETSPIILYIYPIFHQFQMFVMNQKVSQASAGDATRCGPITNIITNVFHILDVKMEMATNLKVRQNVKINASLVQIKVYQFICSSFEKLYNVNLQKQTRLDMYISHQKLILRGDL